MACHRPCQDIHKPVPGTRNSLWTDPHAKEQLHKFYLDHYGRHCPLVLLLNLLSLKILDCIEGLPQEDFEFTSSYLNLPTNCFAILLTDSAVAVKHILWLP